MTQQKKYKIYFVEKGSNGNCTSAIVHGKLVFIIFKRLLDHLFPIHTICASWFSFLLLLFYFNSLTFYA